MTVIIVTGIQASGKSTVAQGLAERLERSVHLRGDLFRRMVVNGRVEMGPEDPPVEAVRQLRLRHAMTAVAADGYAGAGFTVVVQDNVYGSHLPDMVAAIRARPLYVVALTPRVDVVQARDDARRAARGKVAYRPGDSTIARLDAHFRRDTPRIGLWLDTSEQSADETVDEIFDRYVGEAGV